MKDATATVGTSLEILAPFLPYGIDIQTNWKDGPRIGQLSSLNYHQSCVGVKLHGEDELQTLLVFELCLPVLRPFSQIAFGSKAPVFYEARNCTKELRALLEYAVGCEVDKIAYFFAERTDAGNSLNRIYLQYELSGERLDASFWSDGTALVANIPTQCLDYLRSKHFALPVNGRPLVEGVDYIAKAPAPPTPSLIQEGEVSNE